MAIQQINVSAVNPIDFVNRILELGAQGAKLKGNTYPRIKGIPFSAQLVIEVEENAPVENSPGVNAIPVAKQTQDDTDEIKDVKVFTKEELEALDWADFRKVVGDVGVSGRQRNVMTAQYLKKTSE